MFRSHYFFPAGLRGSLFPCTIKLGRSTFKKSTATTDSRLHTRYPPRRSSILHSRSPKMPGMPEFRYFSSLPPELRRQVWGEALEHSPTIWVAKATASGCGTSHERWNLTMRSVTPTSYMAGWACGESWDLMQRQRHCLDDLEGSDPSTVNRAYWMDLGRNTLDLGKCDHAINVIRMFVENEAALVRHVVLRWGPLEEVTTVIRHLAMRCRNIRTVIFQSEDWVADEHPELGFDGPNPEATPELAVFYQSILCPDAPEVSTGTAHSDRQYVKDIFDWMWGARSSRPRALPKVHFVTPHEVLASTTP